MWEIKYKYGIIEQKISVLATSFEDAKRQFNETNLQFGNCMEFIDAIEISR